MIITWACGHLAKNEDCCQILLITDSVGHGKVGERNLVCQMGKPDGPYALHILAVDLVI